MVDNIKCGPDGVRCDVYGNVWSSSNAGRNLGYSGVTVWSPEGKLLGRIDKPEYDTIVGEVRDFLGGRNREVQQALGKRMATGSPASATAVLSRTAS